jgi:phosphatidylethanolamine-binding protein
MLLLSTTVALSFLGSLVYAQSSGNTTLDIAAIEAHFKAAYLVPSLIPIFDPSAVMSVNFTSSGVVSPGQNLTEEGEEQHAEYPLSRLD